MGEVSHGKTRLLPPEPGGFTHARAVRLLGVPVPCQVAPRREPSIRFLFVGSGFCRRLPPDPASRRRPCLGLLVPVVTAEKGLAPLRNAPCVAHTGGTATVLVTLPHAGDITLETDTLSIEVALWPMCQDREVAFRRTRGRNQWASVHELVSPDRFAARIRRELGLAPALREPTRLSA